MNAKRKIGLGLALVAGFFVFTWLVQRVDVQPLGVNGTNIGFASFNCAFHKLFGENLTLYTVTDWAGLVPIFVAFGFGGLGLAQLLKRRSLWKVDADILILGVHYLVVAALYVVFEMLPINYRPILLGGYMEVSYPSSTTLLVLGVMPTLMEQMERRCKNRPVKLTIKTAAVAFSVFMVVGRLLSGVHWFTDILGSVIISMGLFYIYSGVVQEKLTEG